VKKNCSRRLHAGAPHNYCGTENRAGFRARERKKREGNGGNHRQARGEKSEGNGEGRAECPSKRWKSDEERRNGGDLGDNEGHEGLFQFPRERSQLDPTRIRNSGGSVHARRGSLPVPERSAKRDRSWFGSKVDS
jgi:hypothetical protein